MMDDLRFQPATLRPPIRVGGCPEVDLMTGRLSKAGRSVAVVLLLALGLALGACGSDPKEESTTPEEFLKQERAKRASDEKKKAGVGETKGAEPKGPLTAEQDDKLTEKIVAAKGGEGQTGSTGQGGKPAAGDKDTAAAADQAGHEKLTGEPTKAMEPTVKSAAQRYDVGTSVSRSLPVTPEVRSARLLIGQGKYEQAIRECKKALKKDEKYTLAMVAMARAYYELKKYEFAESICDIALSIKDNLGECHNIKGFVAMQFEDDPLAMSHFRKGTQVDPNFGPPWLNLGALLLRAKNYRDAVPALERAARLMPKRAAAHLNYGAALRGAGEYLKAYNELLRAKQLRPTYPDVHYNLGVLFLDAPSFPGMDLLQQMDKAVEHFNTYKKQVATLASDDPVDDFIREAQKKHEKEVRRLEREKRRAERAKARDAAKAAEEARKAAEEKKKQEQQLQPPAGGEGQPQQPAPPAGGQGQPQPAPPAGGGAAPQGGAAGAPAAAGGATAPQGG